MLQFLEIYHIFVEFELNDFLLLSLLRVYSPASCDDEVKDILLLRRINMLHWLKPDHLDLPLDMKRYEVQGVFEQARDGQTTPTLLHMLRPLVMHIPHPPHINLQCTVCLYII